ncbi:PEGA domain-containing protein [Marinilabilia rubra]|uniref:Uncharacterized protein n=1 Tax=Marinilabilia rubra TaxID=2162893 RepID=A0A2U2B602_9BACT|nr:PEGA domain-containing protein [Marinilabilia rubra]PWD98463.1 hypothetical protein DDZ16_15395 [Marinilabilia rubra]
MNMLRYVKALMLFCFIGFLSFCSSSDGGKVRNSYTIKITAEEKGVVYLNGKNTGNMTPAELNVGKGEHVFGVGTDGSNQYFRREIDVDEDAEIFLSTKDQPDPKVWKALWVGVHEVKGSSPNGVCSSHFSKEELNAGYEFFMWSIENHFESFTYNTVKWDVERKDIQLPVRLHKASNTWFTLEPNSITELIPDIKPGEYDAVFVFWPEQDGDCSFESSYFGLAWTDPMNDPIKTGYITIKFDAGSDINEKIAWYKNNDPGVWVHEWLHTVGENYYQDLGVSMPEKGDDGLVLHAAEKYGYSYPWMDWYKEFMGGQVRDQKNGSLFLGIGPETFLKKSLREVAVVD